ncbi:MAG: Spermine synthase [Patescibacteria group bacterium]|nr:Spermine synthase [Patescibacteria group bacterium]
MCAALSSGLPAIPMGKTRRVRPMESILLSITMFITGGCGFIAECLMSTVSAYCLGNSIEQFSVVIALMLLFMGVGAMVQSLINDKYLLEKFILVEIVLALVGGFAPVILFAAYGYMEDHFKLVLYGQAAFIGLLIGLEIPFATRINEGYAKSLGTNISNTVAWDYVGSFIGSVVWVVYLLRNFPLTQIGFLVSAFNMTVAFITFGYFWKKKQVSSPFPILVALVVGTGALGVGFHYNLDWAKASEQRLYDDPVVYNHTTKYQHLVVTHSRDLQEHRLYINGNLQFSSLDEQIYHEQLIHPVLNLAFRREKVLILGGGDGLALREVLKYKDVKEIALVDLDPDMVKLCATNPILKKLNGGSFDDARVHASVPVGIKTLSPMVPIVQETGEFEEGKHGRPRPKTQEVAKVHVFNVDADRFLSAVPGLWDVVIVDLPDPSSIELAKLYSREFYSKIERILPESGLMVVQSTSPYHAKEAYLCIDRTIQSGGFHTLPYHDNVPSFGDWGWVIGWKRSIPDSAIEERVRGLTIPVKTRYLSPERFRAACVFGKGSLRPRYTDVSSLKRPVILEYYAGEGWQVE